MIRHMRHGSPPRLMALQSILSPNRRESLPTPSAGVRITPPYVNRILRRMREEQLVRMEERTLEILDAPGLARIGGFDPSYLQGPTCASWTGSGSMNSNRMRWHSAKTTLRLLRLLQRLPPGEQ